MKKTIIAALILFIGLFSFVSVSYATTTPIRAMLYLDSQAWANQNDSAYYHDDNKSVGSGMGFVDPITSPPAPLSISTSANSFYEDTVTGFLRSITTSASIVASWSSSSEGTVNFVWEYNVTTVAGNASDPDGRFSPAGGYNFVYTFIPDVSGNVVFNYDYSSTSKSPLSPFYMGLCLNNWAATWVGYEAMSAVSGIGSYTFPVTAGNTYLLGIWQGSNMAGGLGSLSQSATGEFSFTIPSGGQVSVPEPATMLLLGLGLVGLAGMRRFKK